MHPHRSPAQFEIILVEKSFFAAQMEITGFHLMIERTRLAMEALGEEVFAAAWAEG